MNKIFVYLIILFFCTLSVFAQEQAQTTDCVTCHKDITPRIVTDWQLSMHFQNEVDCANCHGDQHIAQQIAKLRPHTLIFEKKTNNTAHQSSAPVIGLTVG